MLHIKHSLAMWNQTLRQQGMSYVNNNSSLKVDLQRTYSRMTSCIAKERFRYYTTLVKVSSKKTA